MDKGPVLMVGGTGALGRKVVSELLNRDRRVRMLVRDPVKAEEFARRGVELVHGDMMDLPSLIAAIDGADSVITCAAGYTRHSPQDTAQTDTIGNRNLVDAAATVNIRRFVLTSILTCDKTPQVPHFWHKKLVEDRLVERGVRYVALRPGAFIESVTQFGGDPFARGRLIYAGSARVPFTFVWTTDLAGYLARAVDVAGVDGQHIDIGWTRPVSVEEVADIAARQLQKHMRITVIPGRPLSALGSLIGWANPYVNEMSKMFRWFQSGEYVAETHRKREVFRATTPTRTSHRGLPERTGLHDERRNPGRLDTGASVAHAPANHDPICFAEPPDSAAPIGLPRRARGCRALGRRTRII